VDDAVAVGELLEGAVGEVACVAGVGKERPLASETADFGQGFAAIIDLTQFRTGQITFFC
jgi:hypothetical protein